MYSKLLDLVSNRDAPLFLLFYFCYWNNVNISRFLMKSLFLVVYYNYQHNVSDPTLTAQVRDIICRKVLSLHL